MSPTELLCGVIWLNCCSVTQQFDCQVIASAEINAMNSPASRVSVHSDQYISSVDTEVDELDKLISGTAVTRAVGLPVLVVTESSTGPETRLVCLTIAANNKIYVKYVTQFY